MRFKLRQVLAAAALVAGLLALAGPPVRAATLEDLARDLAADDGDTRRRAAEALGEVRSEEAVDLLARAYRDEVEDAYGVKAACARALGRIGLPAAARPLAAMLDDPDYWVRKKAAEALGAIPGPEAAEALVQAASDPDPRVRAEALGALGRRGGPLEPLRQGLSDPDDRVRAAALGALAEAGAPEVDRLLSEALSSGSWRLRVRAAALLARRGDERGVRVLSEIVRGGEHAGAALREWGCLGERAVPVLTALFGDPGVAPEDRRRVLAALKGMDCPATTAFFVTLATDPAARVGDRLQAAMVLYERRGELTGEQVAAVGELLGDGDLNLRAVALQVLLDRGGPRYLPRIAPLADHENPVLRHFALANLARYGGPEYEAVFVRALSDPKGTNVRLALETLGRLGTGRCLGALEKMTRSRKYRRFARQAIEEIRARESGR